jgi:hypothetical protein
MENNRNPKPETLRPDGVQPKHPNPTLKPETRYPHASSLDKYVRNALSELLNKPQSLEPEILNPNP